MNLRQLCDCCRLLWTFRKEIDRVLLEKRLKKCGLLQEWKAFAALVIDYLGMPVEAMPLYEDKPCWHKKGEWILSFILNTEKPNKLKYTLTILHIFPLHTLSFLPSIFLNLNLLKIEERLLPISKK